MKNEIITPIVKETLKNIENKIFLSFFHFKLAKYDVTRYTPALVGKYGRVIGYFIIRLIPRRWWHVSFYER